MHLQQLGYEIRKARLARGLTQAQLAKAAGLSRTTLNQLENGLFPDLGVKKVQSILAKIGMELSVQEIPKPLPVNFIRMACTTANVSFKETLTEEELIRALLTGKIPTSKRPHIRALLDEATPFLVKGLVNEVTKWTKPGRVEKNLAKIASEVGSSKRISDWLKNG
ncbi:MAG TPA: helix-turn-helix transcriptional regulator [Burkholderiales bacterium]|nr:helix-turn-helix transcriptional regulator [Burkholderiales bacterium]